MNGDTIQQDLLDSFEAAVYSAFVKVLDDRGLLGRAGSELECCLLDDDTVSVGLGERAHYVVCRFAYPGCRLRLHLTFGHHPTGISIRLSTEDLTVTGGPITLTPQQGEGIDAFCARFCNCIHDILEAKVHVRMWHIARMAVRVEIADGIRVLWKGGLPVRVGHMTSIAFHLPNGAGQQSQ